MSAKFYTLLTDIGAAKLASAAALGVPLKITQMAVGDGGGVLPTPSAQQTALVAEKRRASLNMLYIDPQNSSQIIAEQVIPETEGGWWIREVGLFDDTGALIAVGNCPESYKPQLAEGSGRTQTVRMVLITSSTDNITLKIDPSVVLATRKFVEDEIGKVAISAVKSVNKKKPDSSGNVALGSAADANITISSADSTPGRVLKVGDFGLGAKTQNETNNINLDTANLPTGFYSGNNWSGTLPPGMSTSAVVWGYLHVENLASVHPNYIKQTLSNNSQRDIWTRFRIRGSWDVWQRTFTTEFPPTAEQTGALPLNGGSITGDLSVSSLSSAIHLKSAGGNSMLWFKNSDDSERAVIWATQNTDTYGELRLRAKSAKKISDGDFVFDSSGNLTAPKSVIAGAVTPRDYSNFDERYLLRAKDSPAGIPLPWPTATAPDGWLKCNGASFDKAKYKELALVYPSGKLPDLRGEFIRGWDDGRGVDTGRSLLSWQKGTLVAGRDDNDRDLDISFLSNGSAVDFGGDKIPTDAYDNGYLSYVSLLGTNATKYNTILSDSFFTVTRPRNIAFNYIVRAA